MTTQSVVVTRTGQVSLDSEGICRVEIYPGVQETLADAQAMVNAVQSLTHGRVVPLLVDLRLMKSQDREARQLYGSPETASLSCAIALLIESRVSMLIANFFITATKTSVPTKIFTSEAEAVAWLRGHQA